MLLVGFPTSRGVSNRLVEKAILSDNTTLEPRQGESVELAGHKGKFSSSVRQDKHQTVVLMQRFPNDHLFSLSVCIFFSTP